MSEGNTERLFNALADYLRTPIVGIARNAELGRQRNSASLLSNIETSAISALQLIDNYLLSQEMQQGKLQLNLEPVVISSVLYDAAHQLDSLAKAYNCRIEIDAHGRFMPVIAHRQGLQAALISLGQVFIEAGKFSKRGKTTVALATHSAKNGVVAGVFGSRDDLSSQMYRQAKLLYGRARVPFGDLVAHAGVGVFVADSLLNGMSAHLRVARHNKLNGLAATLLPSRQMSLI